MDLLAPGKESVFPVAEAVSPLQTETRGGPDQSQSQPQSLILFSLGKFQLPGSKGKLRGGVVKNLIKKAAKASWTPKSSYKTTF